MAHSCRDAWARVDGGSAAPVLTFGAAWLGTGASAVLARYLRCLACAPRRCRPQYTAPQMARNATAPSTGPATQAMLLLAAGSVAAGAGVGVAGTGAGGRTLAIADSMVDLSILTASSLASREAPL
jgi:hypothetical protein